MTNPIFTIVLLAGAMAVAAACTGDAPDGAPGLGDRGYSAMAGDQARALGIDSYDVQRAGTVSRIHLRGAGGESLGVLTVDETAAYQSASFAGAASANTVDLRASSAGYTIGVNGAERVRITADKQGNVVPPPASDLSDVGPELALLFVTLDDGVVIDGDGVAAYVISDCPWWVTLAACAGCATVGAFVAPCLACGACIGSYLV